VTSIFVSWALSAAALAIFSTILGVVLKKGPLGILLDQRGRYSLTHLQIVVWTIVILSLIAGLFWGRIGPDARHALDFTIPDELLAVLGISVGSGVLATTIKSVKDTTPAVALHIAASDVNHPPRLWQIFTVEEGAMADQVIDISKFQNFVITIILVVAYVILAIATLNSYSGPKDVNMLPGFSPQFVTLLAISHGGYIIGKVPNKAGAPPLSVADLSAA
jgi:hypothetical protein